MTIDDALAKLNELRKSPEEELAAWRRYEENFMFAQGNLPGWRALYPNHWIVVANEQLVAAEPTREGLFERLRQLRGEGIDPSNSYITFLDAEDLPLIL